MRQYRSRGRKTHNDPYLEFGFKLILFPFFLIAALIMWICGFGSKR